MMQAKWKGTLALIDTAKIDSIWSKPRGAKYFVKPDIRSGYHHISIHPESRPKTTYIFPFGKFQWKWEAFNVQTTISVFLDIMFELFFKHLDNSIVPGWMTY